MKSRRRILPTALVLLAIGSVHLVGGAPVHAAERTLVDLHRNAGTVSDKECLACHADIEKAATLDKKFKSFHRVHLESKLDTPKSCSECHRTVDLREGSASALRKQVDPKVCEGCHSGDVKGAKALFAK